MNQLTGVVASAKDALEMLWWCAEVFEHELSSTEGDGSRQGFALIAFAQASANLHHWVVEEHFAGSSTPPSKQERSALFRSLMGELPWSHELRAVSEAARHAKTSSVYWSGSNVPKLRGDDDRMAELDSLEEQQAWFQNMLRGVTDGSLWFENSLLNGGDETDARQVIIEHCSAWQDHLNALRE